MSEEREKQARIKAFLEGKVPVELPKGKLIVLIGSWVIFILFGILALIDLYGPQVATVIWLADFLASELTIPILVMVLVAIGTIIITILVIIRLVKNHAYGLLKYSMIITTAIMWIFFIISFVLVGKWEIYLLFPLIAAIASTVLMILYFTIWKTRLELAAGILGLTGQVTHEEKHLLFPGFMKVFFLGVLTSFGAIMALDIAAYTVPSGNPIWFHYIPTFLFLFGLFFYLYVNVYFFNAIIYSVAYIWYRKKDPTFHDGIAIATYQLPDIALYATFSAIIRFVRMLLSAAAKKAGTKPGWSGGGFRLADGIIGTVWKYVNYFTLPSIVIEDVPATAAIKRSAHRLFDNWVDVLLKEWGVGKVFGVLKFLIVLLFALGGALFGFALYQIWLIPPTVFPLFDPVTDTIIFVVAGAILFMLISTIVSKPLLSLFDDLYLAFLFGFVIDKESNFKHKNNLPKELDAKLRDWFAAHPPVLRCQNCFSKVPDGAKSCPNCSAPYP